MNNQSVFHLFFLLSILIFPILSYKFETCCSNDKTMNSTDNIRLLSCPLNFVIKLRSVNFYMGNGCSPSACQRRLNKHYLACNDHRTCSISIKCIRMDSSICPWLGTDMTHAQYLVVDYDCVLYEPEPPLVALNRLANNNNNNNNKQNENIVLFSAKINIESPPDMINDSISMKNTELTDEERAWKEFILKQYLSGKRPPLSELEKPFIIQQQRSLFSDILRTVIILIIFTFILILLMIIGLFLYKRLTFFNKRRFFGHHQDSKHRHAPFPNDEAYDNLKASAAGSTTDSGTATDV